MKEIKFRQAISHPVTSGFLRWHYWGLIDKAFVGIDTGWVNPTEAVGSSYQYTGLKDKNGKEIYEEDIVAFGMGNKGKVEHSVVNSWCVEYNLIDNPNINRDYSWDDSNKVVQLWKLCQDNRVEVIGNIYENKDLIK